MPSSITEADRGPRTPTVPHNADSVKGDIDYLSYFGGENHHSAALAYLRANGDTCSSAWPFVYKSFSFDNGAVCATVFHQPFLDAMPKAFAPPPQALTPEAYRIGESTLGGVGLFATREIPTGVPVIVEHPCTLIPVMGPRTFKPEDDVIVRNERGAGGTIRYLLSKLPARQAKEFLDLSNCHAPEFCDQEHGILKTNGMSVTLPMNIPEGELKPFDEHTAIFLKINRCNHSCGPNAGFLWNAKSFTMTLYSMRRIAAGEEITTSYVGLEQSRAERQDALRKMYRFDCKCPQCTLPSTAAVAKSDARRREIVAFDIFQLPTFEQWVENPVFSAAKMMAPLKRYMKITDKENLYYPVRYACATILLCMSAAMENEEGFRYWVQVCLSAFLTTACDIDLREGVARSEQTEKMAKWMIRWMANPRENEHWGKRRVLTGQNFM